jgi:transposase
MDTQRAPQRSLGLFHRLFYPLDAKAYKRRNPIERMFCKLKNWRRVATRYDRHAQNYLSGLALAAIMISWI